MEDERNYNTSPSSFPYLSKQLASSTLGGSADVPVVDLNISDEELLVREVTEASQEWGVFQVVNHGIPTELMQQLQVVGKQFFDLPEAEKKAVAKEEDFEGYKRNYLEGIDAWDEHLFHRLSPPSIINYKYWPKNPPQYREVNEEYTRHMKKLAEKILGWLSEGLGLPAVALTQSLGGETAEYLIRINYYPPSPKSELALGGPAHTDIGALALLVPNEVPGLQVFKDEQWLDVEYINSAVVVFIGDQLMRMTNGRFKNVLHRATLNKERLRISWPVFVSPRHDMLVGPLPELTGDENPPKFETLVFKDYSQQTIENWEVDLQYSL
ncbi:PREDICTED: probable flavonol synthase 5 isoform X2 [Camelina sativa]|uniref:Probable flavonol synthase 5 isoform X1 n=1 Tax=Camelina sativa TaxID=90675 RepID=A0ABM1QNN8_CAMSA|nr:PREDICTED: probable flavonol synthase 5 isoform X1 [Camelina sativa]XP_010444269.1 PREDICTED: probable flavonol synthase 5 isoform X3 [Camelina sativa]XP_019088376.1 PREDICTED: probable flavonol synthase 5 isoform X2 [Camelina sativa]